MPADITPGGGATLKDTGIRTPDRETNLVTLNKIVSQVEAESNNLSGRPDSPLRVSADSSTYWTLQAQRGLLSGHNEDSPSLTATLHSIEKDDLPPIEIIRADIVHMFGHRLGGIHLRPRTGERTWDEQSDVNRLAGLAEEYALQSQEATDTAVKDAAQKARAELQGLNGGHDSKWAIEVKPDEDYVTIWETSDKKTVRLIIASPATRESEDGTPARPARITVQDLENGTLVNTGRAPIRDLEEAMRSIFPDRAAIHDEINSAPDNTPA